MFLIYLFLIKKVQWKDYKTRIMGGGGGEYYVIGVNLVGAKIWIVGKFVYRSIQMYHRFPMLQI